MVILILVSLFLASPLSLFLWQHLPLPQLVQFPWRFLALTGFALAVLAKKYPWLILVVIFTSPFLRITRTFHSEGYYTTNDDTTTVQNEYMPKWVKVDPQNRPATPATVYFPGIKVVFDGREVEPEINNNGVVITPGPIIFRETPLRLFADLVSLTTFLACIVFLFRGHFKFSPFSKSWPLDFRR